MLPAQSPLRLLLACLLSEYYCPRILLFGLFAQASKAKVMNRKQFTEVMAELPKYLRPWPAWAVIWRHRMALEQRALPVVCVGLIVLLLGVPYLLINLTMDAIGWSAFDPAISLDEKIPFIAWMIIPYSTLYLYYPLGAILAPRNDTGRREMMVLYQTILLVSWIIFLFFIFLPTEIHIREQIPSSTRTGEGVWGWAYGGMLHNTDKPWNAWPSLHIIQSLLIVLTVDFWWRKKLLLNPGFRNTRSIARTVMWAGWILLSVSILTTKQHFVWDLATGIVVALITWKLVLKPSLTWAESEAGKSHTDAWG